MLLHLLEAADVVATVLVVASDDVSGSHVSVFHHDRPSTIGRRHDAFGDTELGCELDHGRRIPLFELSKDASRGRK